MNKAEEIIEILRSRKLRLTKTRKAFTELFSRSPIPLSVPDILRELQKLRVAVNKTTVYRELERMQNLGIVESVQFRDRKRYYELASRDHHHHLVCVRCERIEDVDVDESGLLLEERKVIREKDFAIVRHSLEFFGFCRQCQS